MNNIREILEQHKSESPSNWLKQAKERMLRDKEEKKVTVEITLTILERMSELSITAEHMSRDLGIDLEDLRVYLSGKKAYPSSMLQAMLDYLKL